MSAKIDGLEEGLRELQEAITKAGEAVQENAAKVIEARSQQAENRIKSEYSRISQNLAGSVQRRRTRDLSQRVTVTAKHSHLVEYGTGPRKTSEGWNRGTMPANPIVGRVANDERRRMVKELVEVVKKGAPGFAPERVEERR